MKRFYKLVSLQETSGGAQILLDGKPVKTPFKKDLLAPTLALADALMREWAGQGETIDPDSMPLTQILNTCLDRVAAERAGMTAALLKYLDTDLLCYRTPHPPELAARQAAAWDPWLAWFAKEFGERLQTTESLTALRQPEAAHTKVAAHVAALSPEEFTALQVAVPASGSLVLGLALTAGQAAAQHLFTAARVEETYKAAIYDEATHGSDPAQAKKDKAVLRDLEAAERFLALLSLRA